MHLHARSCARSFLRLQVGPTYLCLVALSSAVVNFHAQAEASGSPPTVYELARPAAVGTAESATAQPASAPALYSVPFQLRPAAAATVARLDSSLAFYDDPQQSDRRGQALVSTLLLSYKLTDHIAPMLRVGLVENDGPVARGRSSSIGFLNPVIGANYVFKPLPDTRVALFLGAALPLGSGGGDAPDADQLLARTVGVFAHSCLDNAMFAVNDFVIFPGVDVAYVSGRFTAQVEATVLQLTRVRGKHNQPDASRTNFTSGLHLGYFDLFHAIAGLADVRLRLIGREAPQRVAVRMMQKLRERQTRGLTSEPWMP